MNRRRRGFTILELMIVSAIIGLITSIAIPSIQVAIQRAKQRRTMEDMRSIATAVEAYATDFSAYPPSAASPIFYGAVSYPTLSVAVTVGKTVSPTYMRDFPVMDGWNSWFLYGSTPHDYAVVSNAKNGSRDVPSVAGPTTDFNTDIIFSDGQFTVYPSGATR